MTPAFQRSLTLPPSLRRAGPAALRRPFPHQDPQCACLVALSIKYYGGYLSNCLSETSSRWRSAGNPSRSAQPGRRPGCGPAPAAVASRRQDPPARGQARPIQRWDTTDPQARRACCPRNGPMRESPRKRTVKVLLRTPAAASVNTAGAGQDPEFFQRSGRRRKRNGPEKGKSPREMISPTAPGSATRLSIHS